MLAGKGNFPSVENLRFQHFALKEDTFAFHGQPNLLPHNPYFPEKIGFMTGIQNYRVTPAYHPPLPQLPLPASVYFEFQVCLLGKRQKNFRVLFKLLY